MESKKNIVDPVIAFPKRVSEDGTFELTIRCNLHCKMCLFRHDDCENQEIMNRELTAKQWIEMAEQVAKAGTFSLLLTGGEPMLRSDFCEIYEGIYKQGFLLTLYTNATLVTPKIMEVLRKYPPHKIGVTIYGASPDTYEKVCGDASAYERMLHGVAELKTLPSVIDFRTTIIQDNYADIDAIEQRIKECFGDNQKLTQTRIVTQSVRGACADVTECRLKPEDNVRLAYRRGIDIIKKYIGDSYDEANLEMEFISKDDIQEKQRVTLFGCDAGMNSYTVSWDGKLLGCQMLEPFAVDMNQCTFAEAWEEFPYQVKLPELHPDCQNCSSLKICNSCYASRYAETGDLGGKPEYVCEDTKIIEEMLDKRER